MYGRLTHPSRIAACFYSQDILERQKLLRPRGILWFPCPRHWTCLS